MKITNSGKGVHIREVGGVEKLRSLPDHWHAITNLDLALPGKGPREIDVVIITDDRILLVDLKDWVGPIVSEGGNWLNKKREMGRSPVHKISENVRELSPLLRAFLTEQSRKEAGLKSKLMAPWIQGLVVLTRVTDRSGISASELASVFSIDPFLSMMRNPQERDRQLGARQEHQKLTSPEWMARFRRFFNVSGGIFKPGKKRYGGFIAPHDEPTFVHESKIFTEFDVQDESNAMSLGLLRQWDFTKAETRFQNEDGRATIAGREREVISWLNDRSANCESAICQPRIDDPERGVGYWEIYDRRRRIKRLSDYFSTQLSKATVIERIEIARQLMASVKTLHDLQAAHLDLGVHSVWVEQPSTVRVSHLMAASYPQVQTLGEHRYQFLSSTRTPEDIIGGPSVAQRKDVFLLACLTHQLIFGEKPESTNADEPPEWRAGIDSAGAHTSLHDWFERALDWDYQKRFANAADMLDAFNTCLSSQPDPKTVIDGLDRFKTVKSQMQVFREYPELELLRDDGRIIIWTTGNETSKQIVKLWKSTAWGDLSLEAPRILSFLEKAEALIEAPIQGAAPVRRVIWTGDAIVLVQDFVEGRDLATELVTEESWRDSASTEEFLTELVAVVNALHDRLYAHGDIKPENVLVATGEVGDTAVRPLLIDILDFSPAGDGERLSPAYCPETGGAFERDRFAITKIAEEMLGRVPTLAERRSNLTSAIEKCRFGPPPNATLLPLLEALKWSPPLGSNDGPDIALCIPSAVTGAILADEGSYYLIKRGGSLLVCGAIEQLDISMNVSGNATFARRWTPTQSQIQSYKSRSFATFEGHLVVVPGPGLDLSDVSTILEQPQIAAEWKRLADAPAQPVPEEAEQAVVSVDFSEDEITERLEARTAVVPNINVPLLWRRLIDVESELTIEAIADGDSTFRPSFRRHIVPIQISSGALDFNKDDTVSVELQDRKGNWRKVGTLDVSSSSNDVIVVDSWIAIGKDGYPLVSGGAKLRFQSSFENTSRDRRNKATTRILDRTAATAGLIDVFDLRANKLPTRTTHEPDQAFLEERYGLNPVQCDAFTKIVQSRPTGLLQGPPGTGKTRFIGALVHYALSNGLARNVLLASQSHEAVNNAAEAVLSLFGDDRSDLSLIRVGQEGNVSESLKPYHVSRVESAYKDRFSATLKSRLRVVASAIGLGEELASRVIYFEDSVIPVLNRMSLLADRGVDDEARLHSLAETVQQQLIPLGIELNATDIPPDGAEEHVIELFLESFPSSLGYQIARFRSVIELSRDIIGSVSTRQRSFETFLAGTRQVVAGTCVGLGRSSLGLTTTVFDLVIVDEAARCTASELSVPIQAGKWTVLVGDHQQLEPQHRAEVVEAISNELKMPLQEVMRSDFARVFDSAYGVQAGATLTKQYRMLPPIGRIVSSAFYDRALQHGRKTEIIPTSVLPAELEQPVSWVNTDFLGKAAHQKDLNGRSKLENIAEVELIIGMLRSWIDNEKFVSWIESRDPNEQTIGIICSYAAQRALLWNKLQSESMPDSFRRAIKVDTIDSYQGKENVIVVLSLVRNNSDGPIERGVATIKQGFMSRSNRINVAFSRAMDRLIIVGGYAGWPSQSPLGRVRAAFEEECKGGFATHIDANELLAKTKVSTRGVKRIRESKAVANSGSTP